LDSDGDGIGDVADKLLCSNPEQADNDGDGLGDAADPSIFVNDGPQGPVVTLTGPITPLISMRITRLQ
jgi:hypothetical protein